MLKCLAVTISLIVTITNGQHPESNESAIGKNDIASELAPHQVSIQHFVNGIYRHECSGSIISDRWILTAGHCFPPGVKNENYTVIAGTSNRSSGDSFHRIENIIVHPIFDINDSTAAFHDIALIEIEVPFVLDEIRKSLSLYRQNETILDDEADVSGWRFINSSIDGQLPDYIFERVRVPIVFGDKCTMKDGQGCFGHGVSGKGSCAGDTGSALVSNNRQLGILLAGCTNSESTGIFTKVPYYRDWIKKISGV